MRNILITIEYDGTGFCGWQKQQDKRSVQSEIEKALSIVCACPIKINGTSRTDAGVHAIGQRASFSGDFKIPTDRIIIAVNNILSGGMNSVRNVGDVHITKIEDVPPKFHARFDAKGKKYIYKIVNTETIDVFNRNFVYYVRTPLNVELMKQGAQYILGTHDFKCFQASGGEEKKTTVRTVFNLQISESINFQGEKQITIEILGDGFLYNMVRIITGTLVDVGRNKILPEEIKNIIESGDRQKAGHTAPPQGLYLAEVYY